MNILIADDDSGFALILRGMLRKSGHTVTMTKDGVEAWDLLQRAAFSLVISDWMMPGMDGLTLCRNIRARESASYTYIILLTSRCEREDRIEGLSSGADDFLDKPLEHGELFARLEIAQRILTMQETLKRREEETARLNDRLQQQNEQMTLMNQFLETARDRFAKLFEGLPVACYAYDIEGRVQKWNRTAAELFGYEAHEAHGQPIWSLVPELGSARLWQERMAQILSGSAHAGIEVQTQTKAGATLRLLSHAIPVQDGEGRITSIISAAIDITARQALEQQAVEHLRQVTALNADLERFASIACHDMQEPLCQIQFLSSRLADQYGDTLGPQGTESVACIRTASERMQTLIRDLFALIQIDRDKPAFVAVDLGQIAREVVLDLEPRLQETGGCVEIMDLPTVSGDHLQLRQLLQNLIDNGLKYHRPGEPPLVTVRAGGAGRLEVADNGIGFEEQYLSRIFAPFQRLHGAGEYEGTGIGLAICKKIVDRHGGTITARSAPGCGATFLVDLPRSDTKDWNAVKQ